MMKIPPNAKYQPQNPEYVGHETNATDINNLRSRLFVGCLNLELCTRNDVIELFSMYGPIKGLTFFAKGGYAFVQFEKTEDAEDAVLNLNRYMFQGIRLDVKFAQKDKISAMEAGPSRRGGFASRGAVTQNTSCKRTSNESASFRWGKQAKYVEKETNFRDYTSDYMDEGFGDGDNSGSFREQHRLGNTATRSERQSEDDENSNDASNSKSPRDMSPEAQQRKNESIKNRIFQNCDDEEGSVLDQNEIPDLMICGECHLVTSSLDFFYAHRQRCCDRKIVIKHEDEPEKFACFHCSDTLRTSWELLYHLNIKHKVCLYRETEPQTIEYPPIFAD